MKRKANQHANLNCDSCLCLFSFLNVMFFVTWNHNDLCFFLRCSQSTYSLITTPLPYLILICDVFNEIFVSVCYTGVEISRAFSPESSDSGNETNSSEMTESSELTTAQRHSENHPRMHVVLTEGYHAMSEEKAEITGTINSGTAAMQYNSQEHQEEEGKSSAISSQIFHSDGGEMEPETMEIKSVSDYFSKMHMGSVISRQRGKQREAESRLQGDACKSSDKSYVSSQDLGKEEPPHLVGKYNTFTVRDSYYMNQLDLGRTHLKERPQKWQQRVPENKMAEHLSPECVNDSQASHADRLTAKGEKQDSVERSQQLNPQLCSLAKGPLSAEGDAAAPDNIQQQFKIPSTEQDVTRLYECHLSKRMSSIQSEGIHSLQSSQCSSIDAGCSTGSSSCVTPMDSPLCVTDNMHVLSESSLKGLSYVTSEERAYGHPGQGKVGHTMDPTLLRKIHTATSAEPGLGITRDGGHRIAKIKETTGKTKQEVALYYLRLHAWMKHETIVNYTKHKTKPLLFVVVVVTYYCSLQYFCFQ